MCDVPLAALLGDAPAEALGNVCPSARANLFH
jgi:hypothetical protein